MSEPGQLPKPNKKGKYVSFGDPIATAAGPSSSYSNSTGADQAASTQSSSHTAIHAGDLPPIQAVPTQRAMLPIYRPVSNIYPGPRSALQAGFQAAPTTTSFSDHINQTNDIVYANIRGQPLLQPELITHVDEAVYNAEHDIVRDRVDSSMGMESANSTPRITEHDALLPLASSASNTRACDIPNGGVSLYGLSNQAPNQDESRYETEEDTPDNDQDHSLDSDSTFDGQFRTLQELVANSSPCRNDPLEEFRPIMVENRTTPGNHQAAQSFSPALSSNTQSSRSALRPITLAPPPGLPINRPSAAWPITMRPPPGLPMHMPSALRYSTLAPPPGLPINRPSDSIYHQSAHPAASYVTNGGSCGSSSSRSTPYMGSGSFAPGYTAPGPYAPTSGFSRQFLFPGYHGSTGTSVYAPSQFTSSLTNIRNHTAPASGLLSSANQDYQGNLNSERRAGEVRDENCMGHVRFPGQIPQHQNPFQFQSYQRHSVQQSLPSLYGNSFVQQLDRSGSQEAPSIMHAQQGTGNRHVENVLFREQSRNRQVFQNRPRPPYTPSRSPSAYLLYEDPPGTVIPDNEGLNPYELRDREAAADALLRLNSEDEDEVDLTLERLHSRRRRIENEARALRLEQEEDCLWNLLEEKEAKKAQRG